MNLCMRQCRSKVKDGYKTKASSVPGDTWKLYALLQSQESIVGKGLSIEQSQEVHHKDELPCTVGMGLWPQRSCVTSGNLSCQFTFNVEFNGHSERPHRILGSLDCLVPRFKLESVTVFIYMCILVLPTIEKVADWRKLSYR